MIQFPDVPDPSNQIDQQTQRLLALMQNRPPSTGQALGLGAMGAFRSLGDQASTMLAEQKKKQSLSEAIDMASSTEPKTRTRGLLMLGITPPELQGRSSEQQLKLFEQKKDYEDKLFREKWGITDLPSNASVPTPTGQPMNMPGNAPVNAPVPFNPKDNWNGVAFPPNPGAISMNLDAPPSRETMSASPDTSGDVLPGIKLSPMAQVELQKRQARDIAKDQNLKLHPELADAQEFKKEKFWAAEWDKAIPLINPLVAKRGSALGMAANNNNRVNRIMSNLDNPGIIDEELGLATLDLAAVTTGGVPHESVIAKTNFDNLKRRLIQVKAFLTSTPQPLNNPAVVNKVKMMMKGIIKADNDVIRGNLRTQKLMLAHVRKNDPQRWDSAEKEILSQLPPEDVDIPSGNKPPASGKGDDIDALINKHL